MTVSINANPGQTLILTLNVNDGYSSNFTTIQETLAVTAPDQRSFTLSHTPAFPSAVLMFINGVKQTFSTDFLLISSFVIYSAVNGVHLTTADVVDFYYVVSSLSGVAEDVVSEVLPILNPGQSTFTLTQVPSSPSSVIIFGNGILQTQNVDYTLTGQNITFLTETFTSPNVVSAYYPIGGDSDGYGPTIDLVRFPNGSIAPNFPQNMTLLVPDVWIFSLTLPTVTVGTYIVIASYVPTSSQLIQKEVFMINVSTGGGGGGFVAPG
jgi:hypothetical protein